ncbi:MAG: hypothetical protein OK436_06440, partial [Thaumarchaeota archaeon]|nr:hypothetical protein [Nitrososphaerota archaeon]
IKAVIADFKQKAEVEPSFWEKHPNLKAAAKGVTATLPAIGALAGGALAAPGIVSTPLGVGLGAGVGRGAQDLIEEGVGLSPKSSPMSKAGRIGLDTALGTGTEAVLPGVIEAAKTPLKTAGEMASSKLIPPGIRKYMVPESLEALRPPKGAPKPILERPVEEAVKAAPARVSQNTGTSFTPGKMPVKPPTRPPYDMNPRNNPYNAGAIEGKKVGLEAIPPKGIAPSQANLASDMQDALGSFERGGKPGAATMELPGATPMEQEALKRDVHVPKEERVSVPKTKTRNSPISETNPELTLAEEAEFGFPEGTRITAVPKSVRDKIVAGRMERQVMHRTNAGLNKGAQTALDLDTP